MSESVDGRQTGQAPLDKWSWVHLGSGLTLGLLFSNAWISLCFLVGFEFMEAGLRRLPSRSGKVRGLMEYESWPNILADVAVGLAGVALVRILWPGDALLF